VPTILRPHHIGITVSDLDRSVGFYCDVLGFEYVFGWNPTGDYITTIVGYPEADIHSAIMRMPGSDYFLELMEMRNVEKHAVDTGTANPGVAHVAFFTDDCDGLYAELRAKGVESVSAPVTPTIGPNKGGRAVYMLDPDGVRLEFTQTSRSFGEYAEEEPTTNG
jgi:lactoylglutathione lyase